MKIEVVVVKVFRKGNKITGYRIKDRAGNNRDVTPEQLKFMIRNGSTEVLNFKLTSNNRLIHVKEKKRERNTDTSNNTYLIMNKNKIAAEFDLNFGLLNKYSNLPYGFKSINEWIEQRAKFSCARDVNKFFESIGIADTKSFIEVTHCVSLHDTFWVKRKDSKLKWNNVSPFINNYSDIISTYALEGIYLGNNGKNYFSPVIGTDGSFPHTWKKVGNKIYFIKAGSKYTLGGCNSGREPYSEYYASKVAKYLGFECVEYRIRNHKRHDGRIDTVTECECFTNERIGSVPAHTLGIKSYEEVIRYCSIISSKALEKCIDMLFLDCLLLNTDRHFGNIEFLVNNDTLEIIDLAPIFDNNYSLLPRFIEGMEEFNLSDYVARDNRTFDELYKLVRKYKSYNREMIKLKKFSFEKIDGLDISTERVKFLNWFLQERVNYLLK